MAMESSPPFLRRLLVTVLVVSLTVVVLLGLWTLRDVVLLSFAALLAAVMLRSAATFLASLVKIDPRWTLVLVVLVLLAALTLGLWRLAPALASQFEALGAQLGEAIGRLEEWLQEQPWGERLLEQLPDMNEVELPIPGMEALGQVTSTFALVLALFKDIFFLIFLALFLAFDPTPYREGLIALFPRPQRGRAREVLAGVLQALRAWLLGRLISMVVLGVVIWLGLWLLGVPLALPLAVLAGLFEFVPIVGPIVASIPAILVAFVEGPMLALYVAILYFVVQQLESSILTPLVQERTVKLPPALTLFAVLAFGLLFGVLGAILATPLAAVLLVLVKMLYLGDTLERR